MFFDWFKSERRSETERDKERESERESEINQSTILILLFAILLLLWVSEAGRRLWRFSLLLLIRLGDRERGDDSILHLFFYCFLQHGARLDRGAYEVLFLVIGDRLREKRLAT